MKAWVLVAVAGLVLAAAAGTLAMRHGGPTTCDGRIATVVGTSGDDDLVGTAGPDIIAALDGSDVVAGLGGDDVLCGGSGTDWLRGGGDRDLLDGGAGRDRIDGGPGTDLRITTGPDVLAHVEAVQAPSPRP